MNTAKKIAPKTEKTTDQGTKASESTMKVVKEEKPTEPKELPKMTASQRVQKLELMNGLASKMESYKMKLQELDKFIHARDEFGYSIVLKNPGGQDVQIKRLDVCEEIIVLLKEKVEISLNHVEKQIETFEI